MKSIKQIRLAFLEETVAHYNFHNRGWSKNDNGNGCVYSPVADISEGCAIGRHIKDKELCARLDTPEFGGVNLDKTFDALPKKLQKLGQEFLKKIQELHDVSTNWNDKGLSEQGKDIVKYIKLTLVD